MSTPKNDPKPRKKGISLESDTAKKLSRAAEKMAISAGRNLMDGVKNTIDSLHVRKDEIVLIVAETGTDPEIIQAFRYAINDVGAKLNIILVDEGTPVLDAATKKADVLIGLGGGVGRAPTFLGENNARGGTMILPGKDFLTSEAARFPHEIISSLAKKVREILVSGETLRVTDPGGSDLKVKLDEDYIMAAVGSKFWSYDPRYPVVYGFLPITPVVIIGPIGAEGVICWDYCEGYKGRLVPPLKLTFKNERVTKVEGAGAEWMEEMFEHYEDINHPCEFGFGLNPKIDPTIQGGGDWGLNKTWLASHKAGVLFLSLGPSWGGRPLEEVVTPNWPGDWHGNCMKSTVYVGNKLLIDGGRLTVLDDPEVREIAAKYGDPDEVLREIQMPRKGRMLF